jgi:hypothetical protein
VPTGRVSIEDVIYFIVQELGIKPLQEDWKTILEEERQPFMRDKTW